MGDSPKWVKSKKRRKKKERKKERLNDGGNNGQAMYGARKHTWRTQAAWAKMFPFKDLQVMVYLSPTIIYQGQLLVLFLRQTKCILLQMNCRVCQLTRRVEWQTGIHLSYLSYLRSDLPHFDALGLYAFKFLRAKYWHYAPIFCNLGQIHRL